MGWYKVMFSDPSAPVGDVFDLNPLGSFENGETRVVEIDDDAVEGYASNPHITIDSAPEPFEGDEPVKARKSKEVN